MLLRKIAKIQMEAARRKDVLEDEVLGMDQENGRRKIDREEEKKQIDLQWKQEQLALEAEQAQEQAE